jgi:hypothetical protein
MKKPSIPAPESVIYCIDCRKPTNGKGYFGGECQCNEKLERNLGHSIRVREAG